LALLTRFNRIVAGPSTEAHGDLGRNVFLNEQVIRPTPSKVVRRHAPVILVTSFVGGRVRSVINPFLKCALRPVSDWLVTRDAFLLDVPM
jgi:hypothetical protein